LPVAWHHKQATVLAKINFLNPLFPIGYVSHLLRHKGGKKIIIG
jgi:hypothetical protein